MKISPKEIFPSHPLNILSLTRQSRSLYSATHDRLLCSVPQRRGAVRRFPQLSLETMAAPPFSWRVRAMENLENFVSSVKDMVVSRGNTHGTNAEEERFKKLIKAKEKTAKIHVYVQDALGGLNPTVWEVARSIQTVNSPTTFGQVRVVDDLVTAGPDRDSEKLGRTQGLITSSDMSEQALTMNLNFYFTGGEHKGSSICIGGRNPINNKDREMPIIGGTGVFKMARGYTIANTYSFDAVSSYGVLEYTFYVAYPDHCCC
ncbi:dirigent protein 21-like [Primulina eburnea]|uniref:dirigent protein 21-like n=1 Tax=Primulina eburnea TaxID=1245227 RepID=UPI003C6BDFBC